MDEVWMPVIGFEGFYEVSNFGEVRSLERLGVHSCRWGNALMKFPAKKMSISTSKNGYQCVKLKLPGEKPKHCLVHRLVMAAHVGLPPSESHQVNHIDGDKKNNLISNLEYCSSHQNLRHCIDVLGKKRGEGMPHKVTEAGVRAIRSDKRMLKEIARDYGVTMAAISSIKTRRNWAHVE